MIFCNKTNQNITLFDVLAHSHPEKNPNDYQKIASSSDNLTSHRVEFMGYEPVTCATTAWEILLLPRKALISSFTKLLSRLQTQRNKG